MDNSNSANLENKPISWEAAPYAGPTLHLWMSLFCVAGLFVALRTWSAPAVQASLFWQVFYLVGGYFWASTGWRRMGEFATDILLKQDVLERSNKAADLAIAAIVLGNTLCYVGANIGDGPGPEVVLFSALLASSGFTVGLFLFRLATLNNERITIERNLPSAVRFASFALGSGLLLGRSVTGNWIGVNATLSDFLPWATSGLVLLVGAVVMERAFQSPLRARSGSSWRFTAVFSALMLASSLFFLFAH